MTKLCQIWVEVCEMAVAFKAEFGSEEALNYLVGERFLDFLDASDSDPDFRAEIPAFVDEIKMIFEHWQLTDYFERWQTKPFSFSVFGNEKSATSENKLAIRQSAAKLLLMERAREWLL